MIKNIPLFPLQTVLFPEGILPLRIFEARYIDMVSESLRTGSGFGVCLISKGKEVGEAADCHEVGTLAHIIDWERGDDGLLEVTAQGKERFQIIRTRVRPNQLLEGDVVFIDDNLNEELPIEYQLLSDLLRQIADKFELPHLKENKRFTEAEWVGCRLAELLPMELYDKQILLEIDDPVQRLEQIRTVLQAMKREQHSP